MQVRDAARTAAQYEAALRMATTTTTAATMAKAGAAEIPAKVRAVFESFDRDRSGGLNVRELRPALRRLGLDASAAQAIALLKRFDSDSDGSLDCDEFGRLVRELTTYQRGQAAEVLAAAARPGDEKGQEVAGTDIDKAFEHFDADGSGHDGTPRIKH